MKRTILSIIAALMIASSASAQKLANINIEASFITDKMITELGLSNSQRNGILQINLNYLNGINSYRDIKADGWKHRNKKLRKMLSDSQWKRYKASSYFYSPIGWNEGGYIHYIYNKYPKQRGRKQFGREDADRRFGTPPPPPPHDKRFDNKPPKHKKGDKKWKWER